MLQFILAANHVKIYRNKTSWAKVLELLITERTQQWSMEICQSVIFYISQCDDMIAVVNVLFNSVGAVFIGCFPYYCISCSRPRLPEGI